MVLRSELSSHNGKLEALDLGSREQKGRSSSQCYLSTDDKLFGQVHQRPFRVLAREKCIALLPDPPQVDLLGHLRGPFQRIHSEGEQKLLEGEH